MTATISWNREKLAALKLAYEEALKERKTQFIFVEMQGKGFFAKKIAEHPFVMRYAKYLIEYLDGEFAKQPDQPKQPYREGEEGQ